MLTANCVRFDGAFVETSPFRHFTIENFIDEDLASSLLRWFDEEADWNAKSIAGLGTLSSVDLHTSELGPRLDFLTGDPFLSHVRRNMSELFGTKLEGFVDLTANRMTRGQEIGLHNDVSTLPPAFRFTHRLVLYLNHNYSEEYGGVLRLANTLSKSQSAPVQKRILPLHRSAFGFEISESSYHAIEPVRMGTRYNLSFTFYPGAGATNIV
jgi:Rps23 Pro-64 3,4-dihydroxylase Tpa1-like proline 4-hydroxylase